MSYKMKDKEEMNWLMKVWNDAEAIWTRTSNFEIRRAIKRGLKYIDGNYDNSAEVEIDKVIEDFNKSNARFLNSRGIMYGYAYYRAAMEDFLKNPNLFWELYDRTKNKEAFLELTKTEYGTDRQKNLYIFVKDCFSSFFDNKGKKVSVSEIERLNEEQKKAVLDHVTDVVSKVYKSDAQKTEKELLITGLQNSIKELEVFGTLEENENQYNDFMRKMGLDSLMISHEKDTRVPLTQYFTVDFLKQFSYFQLESLYSFYTNRVEKIEEEVGLGLFLISTIVKARDYDNKGDYLDDENLKLVWHEYFIFHKIFEEKRDELSEVCTPNTDLEDMKNLKGYESEEVYEKLFKRYEKLLNHLLGNKRDIKKDFITFCETNGLAQLNNYTIKNLVLEDIIILANNEKINWGYIEDVNNPGLQKYVLIGVDVPGLSMPLRLHLPRKRLKVLMKDYLKINEIPVYVGSEDFEKDGNNIGTSLILPITPKQRDTIKRVSSANKKEKQASSVLQHIACTQLPNPVQKLLKWKYGGKKKYPDFINIETGEIRNADANPSAHGAHGDVP